MRMGLCVTENRVSAVALRRGHTVWAAEATFEGEEDLSRVLATLASERPRGARTVAVALAAGAARLKTVDGLPRLKRRDLVAHVRLNSRRYFLQNGIPLVTDAVPLETGGALLAGTPAPLVEALAAGLEAAGLRCRLIVPADLLPAPSPNGGVPDELSEGFRSAIAAALAPLPLLSLLPDAARARHQSDLRLSLLRWTVAAASAALLAVATWIVRDILVSQGAERELARLKPGLEAALSARRDLDASDAALSLISGLDADAPRRGRFLADLTRALPDSAFLVSVRLDPDDSGWLSGYAPSAAATVARLERAGLIRDARMEGSVTREIQAGRELERFSLRFRVAQGNR